MTPSIDIVVTVQFGGHRRQITVAMLAESMNQDVASVRRMLLVLLFNVRAFVVTAPVTASYPQALSTVRTLVPLPERNEVEYFRSDGYPFEQPGSSVQAAPGSVDNIESVAAHLVDALQDEKSLAFYKLVAARVPRGVIRDALAAALDVPARDVRRSRAAIFTALIRPHLPTRPAPAGHHPNQPYDFSSNSS